MLYFINLKDKKTKNSLFEEKQLFGHATLCKFKFQGSAFKSKRSMTGLRTGVQVVGTQTKIKNINLKQSIC